MLQVGYISEYPHTGQAVSAAEGGLDMTSLFWGGKCVELDQGKKVFGQVWPKVCVQLVEEMLIQLHMPCVSGSSGGAHVCRCSLHDARDCCG